MRAVSFTLLICRWWNNDGIWSVSIGMWKFSIISISPWVMGSALQNHKNPNSQNTVLNNSCWVLVFLLCLSVMSREVFNNYVGFIWVTGNGNFSHNDGVGSVWFFNCNWVNVPSSGFGFTICTIIHQSTKKQCATLQTYQVWSVVTSIVEVLPENIIGSCVCVRALND